MKFATIAALAAASLVSAAEHRVKVGVDEAGTPGNFFTPSQIDAAEGDLVHFEFLGGNHTVTQGSFAVPCTQQFNTKTQLPGVDSGFVPANPDPAGPVPIWTVEVLNGKAPLWLFCNRNPHCSGAGMVFAINAPAEGERTFEKFLANAKAGGEQPGPGVFEDFTPPPPADAPVVDPATQPDGQITDPNLDPAIQPDGQITDPNLDPATQPDGQITDPNLDPAPITAPQAPIGSTDPALALPVNPIGNSVIPAEGSAEAANAASGASSSRVVSGVLVSLVGVVAAALF